MAKPTTTKSKSSKKGSKKKLHNAVHPYMECVQAEVTSLQEQLAAFDTKQDLTPEEKSEKAITEACLARYQATLAKFAETSMLSKLQQFNSIAENEIKQRDETQTMSFLQLLYLMRLGQLGLYQYIDQAPPLDSIATLSDQIIGAAVHYAKHKSLPKRQKALELLRKFDQASTEKIDPNLPTTFKHIKDFLQHIWDNTTEPEHVHSNQNYPVIQFEGMIDTQPPSSSSDQQQPLNPEPPTTETIVAETNAQPTDTTVEPPTDTNVEPKQDTPEPTTTTTEPAVVNSPKETTPTTAAEPPLSPPESLNVSDKTTTQEKSGWDDQEPISPPNQFDSWEKSDPEPKDETAKDHGWNSVETNTTIDNWNNQATKWSTENVIEDTTSSAAVESKENDNWRSRDESSRGRGRGGSRGAGLRGRGRGTGAPRGRGRGRGGPVRGRGRGRGRDMDDDYNRDNTPSQQQQQ